MDNSIVALASNQIILPFTSTPSTPVNGISLYANVSGNLCTKSTIGGVENQLVKSSDLTNAGSTGLYSYSGTTKATSSTFTVNPVSGWIVYNTNNNAGNPNTITVSYSGITTTTPYLASADATYMMITSASTLTLQPTHPTPTDRRNNIYLGKVVHPDRASILTIDNICDYTQSPMSTVRDMFTPFRYINEGIVASANGSNMSLNFSQGNLWGVGINWVTNQQSPNMTTISSKTSASFFYRTQIGGSTPLVTTINPTVYNPTSGTLTAIPTNSGDNRASNQRIYLYPTGVINVQYGQQVYGSLSLALAGQQTEVFVKCPNVASTATLIGLLAVKRAATNLSDISQAVFTPASMIGESIGGVNGISTTTLQQAYNNSITPEITTDSTRGSLTIKEGTGNALSAVFDVYNNSDVNTYKVLGNGCVVIPKTSGIGVKIDVDTPDFGWKDLIGQIVPRPSGGPAPVLGIFLTGTGGTPKIQNYAFAAADVIDNVVFHIPHDYVPGTDMFLHLHWGHNGTAIAGSFVINWAATYAKGYSQAVFSPEIAITQTISTPNIATIPRWQHRIDEFQLTNNGGDSTHLDRNLIEVDGLLIVSLTTTTIPTITGGTPSNPYIFMADIHYQSTSVPTKGRNYPFYT